MRRAPVIGGSLGGLLATHLLRKAGWDAVVFERNAAELPSRQGGYLAVQLKPTAARGLKRSTV